MLVALATVSVAISSPGQYWREMHTLKYLCRINCAWWKSIKGRQVSVSTDQRFLRLWTVVNTTNNFGPHKGTCKSQQIYINKKEIYLRSECIFKAERMLLTILLTFSYNALHTDHVSNQMSWECPGCNMLWAKTRKEWKESYQVKFI